MRDGEGHDLCDQLVINASDNSGVHSVSRSNSPVTCRMSRKRLCPDIDTESEGDGECEGVAATIYTFPEPPEVAAPLHELDDQDNRLRYLAFDEPDDTLTKSDLWKAWEAVAASPEKRSKLKFTNFNDPTHEILAAISLMPEAWHVNIKHVLWSAFPAYKQQRYSIVDIVVAEILKHFETMAERRWAKINCPEFMSGKSKLRKSMLRYNLVAVGLDRKYTPYHDMTTDAGRRTSLVGLRRLGGLAWMAPECTTWVWIGRMQTGRHNDIEGNYSRSVVEANTVRDFIVFM